MQRALAGFVCLTALQELLLAHRKHYFVDLLAGVRKGESEEKNKGRCGGRMEERRDERDKGRHMGEKRDGGEMRLQKGLGVCVRKIKAHRE